MSVKHVFCSFHCCFCIWIGAGLYSQALSSIVKFPRTTWNKPSTRGGSKNLRKGAGSLFPFPSPLLSFLCPVPSHYKEAPLNQPVGLGERKLKWAPFELFAPSPLLRELGAGSIGFRAIVNNKQCERRWLFMSLVTHYWIGDVQVSRSVSILLHVIFF